MISTIVKRDGRKVNFDSKKISDAIFKAAVAAGGNDHDLSESLAQQVVGYLEADHDKDHITVEHIQDVVEKILIENGHALTAKEFILYSADRSRA